MSLSIILCIALSQEHYHKYCPVDYSNITSEQLCWLGDLKVPLPDVNTELPDVVSGYQAWIKELVQTYNIDGLRIDAAKYVTRTVIYNTHDMYRLSLTRHVNVDFWPQFCGAAGVFCIGEVFDDDTKYVLVAFAPGERYSSKFIRSLVASFQGSQALDSVLHYPMYGALVDAFAIPGALNISALADMIVQSKQKFKVGGAR